MPGISDKLWDKLRNTVSGQPSSSGVPNDPDISPSLWNRLKERVKNVLGPNDAEIKNPEPEKALTDEIRRQRIRQAGRAGVMLLMRYNGSLRKVEPYSFRYRTDKKTGQKIEYFYGYCMLHSIIECYKLPKIEELYVTGDHYRPRWTVETT